MNSLNHSPNPKATLIDLALYALIVKGNSMEPLFPAGTALFIDPALQAASGNYVIASDGVDLTFTQLILEGEHWLLKPLNPDYPTNRVSQNLKVCGVVVGAEYPLS